MLMFCGRHIARPLNDLNHRHNTAVDYPVEISPIPVCQRQFGHCNQCSGPRKLTHINPVEGMRRVSVVKISFCDASDTQSQTIV